MRINKLARRQQGEPRSQESLVKERAFLIRMLDRVEQKILVSARARENNVKPGRRGGLPAMSRPAKRGMRPARARRAG